MPNNVQNARAKERERERQVKEMRETAWQTDRQRERETCSRKRTPKKERKASESDERTENNARR